MPIPVRRWIRRMRGGCQAHLVEAGDGHCYILKPRNNPQHRRILVNEWLSSVFLEYLQIQTPQVALLETDAALHRDFPEFSIQLGGRHVPVDAGWHFGSRFPGDPDRLAVFDFLPDALLFKVANLRDFAGALVFDKWVANADSRQAIFYRAQLRDSAGPPRVAFVASMIDSGYAFEGPNWVFTDAAMQGLYHRKQIYQMLRGWSDLEPWLARVESFPEAVVDQAWRAIPRDWLRGDEAALEALLERLLARRRQVRAIIERSRFAKPEFFPNWR